MGRAGSLSDTTLCGDTTRAVECPSWAQAGDPKPSDFIRAYQSPSFSYAEALDDFSTSLNNGDELANVLIALGCIVGCALLYNSAYLVLTGL